MLRGIMKAMPSDVEPNRRQPEPALSHRMSTLARRDTAPELAIRRALHAAGLRYRVQLPVPGSRRRTMDVAFTRAQVALFVDGCFWHGCPEHGVQPRANSDWWRWKLARNQARDVDTTRLLQEQGWQVLRVWEHEQPSAVVEAVRRLLPPRAGR